MIFVLDNYDSFTYNLVQYLQQLEQEVVVKRNDEITIEQVIAMKPEAILLSPGPGVPSSAGIMLDLIRAVMGKIPILGVCLGHQAIGEVFGMQLRHAKAIMHGKTSIITHDKQGLFKNISNNFKGVRYHSLALEESTLPEQLEITARSDDNEVMGIRHKEYLIEGIQYHVESILTSSGKKQLENFLNLIYSSEKRG